MSEVPQQPEFKIPNEVFDELVENYTNDFTARVRAGKTDPIVGRDKVIDEVVTILLQRGRANALLLAPAGTGKTALVVGLAQWIEGGKVPKLLRGSRLIELDMTLMAAGTRTRGEFEGRFMPFIRGVAERNDAKMGPPIILFIDEIHSTMAASNASSAAGVANIMKPYLTAGSLRVVGATTRDEYSDFIKPDPAIDRRFQKVNLPVPTVPEAIHILKKLRGAYEKHFDLKITDEAVEKIVDLTEKYMRKRNHPDKDILVMDASCARAIKKGEHLKELDFNSICETVGSEMGIHPQSLDENYRPDPTPPQFGADGEAAEAGEAGQEGQETS